MNNKGALCNGVFDFAVLAHSNSIHTTQSSYLARQDEETCSRMGQKEKEKKRNAPEIKRIIFIKTEVVLFPPNLIKAMPMSECSSSSSSLSLTSLGTLKQLKTKDDDYDYYVR